MNATQIDDKRYLLVCGTKTVGPYSANDLRKLKAAGKLPEGKGIRIVEAPRLMVDVYEAPAPAVTQVVGHVTTEKTSKPLKLHSMAAYCIVGLGIVAMFGTGSVETGAAVFLAGIGYVVVTKARIWWNHG